VAAACAPQLGNIAKGNVMQRQYQTFTTQAAMAEWVERYELVLGMVRVCARNQTKKPPRRPPANAL